MSLSLLLAMTLAQPAPAPASAQEELVVIAGRLREWRGGMREEGGQTRCLTRRSSGDEEVDKIGCDTIVHCFRANRPALTAAWDRNLPRQRRQSARDAANRAVTACFTERHDLLTAQLAERRYRTRQGIEHADDQ